MGPSYWIAFKPQSSDDVCCIHSWYTFLPPPPPPEPFPHISKQTFLLFAYRSFKLSGPLAFYTVLKNKGQQYSNPYPFSITDYKKMSIAPLLKTWCYMFVKAKLQIKLCISTRVVIFFFLRPIFRTWKLLFNAFWSIQFK